MNNTSNTTQYKNLSDFLSKHNSKNANSEGKNLQITHTRIPNAECGIPGGSYTIPRESLPEFYKLYYTSIFEKKNKEYLTEKQMESGGPIVVDLDFRYENNVVERQHNDGDKIDILSSYLDALKIIYEFKENEPFHAFIFEKPNINRLPELTKDGIHILIGIQSDLAIQSLLREKMLEELPKVISLPLINSWESVLDEGISKGTTNWQLFGSRKPNCEAYELTDHFVITYDKNDGCFSIDERDVKQFDMKVDLPKLSVQYNNHPKFEINPKFLEEYEKYKAIKKNKVKKSPSRHKINRLVDNNEGDDEENEFSLDEIKDAVTLDKAINMIFKGLKIDEYEIKETHEYTQALPEMFYEPGSHSLNRQVAFALKSVDERLFLSWVKLRSKASDFDFNTIPNLYNEWKKFRRSNIEGESVTKRSIIYWLKRYNYEEYEAIKNTTIDYYIEKSISTLTPVEYDFAEVLHKMFKDKYVFVSYDKKGIWYKYSGNRWIIDKGNRLRYEISKSLLDLYSKKADLTESILSDLGNDENSDRREYLKKKLVAIHKTTTDLKKTAFKDHIMREAAEIFYDDNFLKVANTNKYLLCFNNGVIDFKNKVFREGYPEDYITISTNIDYVPYDEKNQEYMKLYDEVSQFMKTLFPIEDLNRYMWDHLASCLIGTNLNQTFHIYHGSGSNGKSILMEFMSAALGDYKGTLPVNLLTDSRVKIGGTCDELLKLKYVRYAPSQELSKGAKLNEGVMKELSASDPIQVRGLYCESETFVPQFKMALATNNLFDVTSNDDGTWRRIRKVPFLAKFVDEGEYYEDDTKYVFKKNKQLSERIPILAPIFASMLVKRAFITNGEVVICETVMEESKKYRKGQDHISAFITEKIRKTNDRTQCIKKKSLIEEFKLWYQQEQGTKDKIPKSDELYEAITKRFKINPHTSKGWIGLEFICDDNEEDDIIDSIGK
jgi:P4 family phage/plasmid primase-like protien